jgi:hypothetical protein
MDDILTCASLDFLGSGGSKKYYNKNKPEDPNNGKFCTVPTRLTFRSKDERIKAEQTLRKLGKIKCSTPYPRRLRTLINEIVQEGKKKISNAYIRAKVDPEKLTITALASVQDQSGKWKWEDLGLEREIPLNILENPDKVILDQDNDSEMTVDNNTL